MNAHNKGKHSDLPQDNHPFGAEKTYLRSLIHGLCLSYTDDINASNISSAGPSQAMFIGILVLDSVKLCL